MSCWRYTPSPKQDRFQDFLQAIFQTFSTQHYPNKNNYHCYSNIPQLLSAEVVFCMHKTTILCQLGLFCHKLTTISPPILSHFWWELYHLSQGYRVTGMNGLRSIKGLLLRDDTYKSCWALDLCHQMH